MRIGILTLLLAGAAANVQAQCSVTITKSGTGTMRTYTASSMATGMFYSWTTQQTPTTGTGASINRTYPYGGTYSVRVVGYKTGTTPCVDSVTITDTIAGPINCNTASTTVTGSGTGLTQTFTTTTAANVPPGYTVSIRYNYGDGTSGTSATHTYASSGTYSVVDTAIWTSSGTYPLCYKVGSTSVTVTAPPVVGITGTVSWDSTLTLGYTPSVKVWLIKYDSSAQTLTAVDSVVATNMSYQGAAAYTFTSPAPDAYRLKAFITNQSASAVTALVPTYADSSVYWNSAATLFYNSGATIYKNWRLMSGTSVPGNGFVSGSVFQGANKGTATGDPVVGQWVYVRDGSNRLVRSAKTDAQGAYTVTNIPTGTYTVYPEEMNYTTTPSASFVITGFQNTKSGVNFRKNGNARTIVPAGTAGVITADPAGAFALTPNPSTGRVNLTVPATAGTYSVSVTAMTGQVVYKLPAQKAANGGVQELDLSYLTPGIYNVTIQSEKGAAHQNLVIQR